MKIFYIFLFSSFLIPYSFSQAPEIEWQNTIGASYDEFRAIEQTQDGGYILGGYSSSPIGGDKTEGSFAQDYWIIKIDAAGNIIWENTLHGEDGDYLTNARQTDDGGYILGGHTQSGSGGDKSENTICDCTGDYDLWIVKVDATGNIEWENTIGGENYDFIYTDCLEHTIDGGYIVGSVSFSGISGDKTENNINGYNYWIFKLNASGNIVWQNTITGGGILQVVRETNEGGFILGGSSATSPAGDKTVGTYGNEDYWVVKTDALGNIEWQKNYGGNKQDQLMDLNQTLDGGYILGGFSYSGISGNKSETVWGGVDNYADYWVIKIDSLGNIIWQNDIGGFKDDFLLSVQQNTNGEYILGGYSGSGATGDKLETPIGGYDYWIVSLNELGNIEWQNTIGGSNDDYLYDIALTQEGGYTLGGTSYSSISGDKTENRIGSSFNYWIVKLFADECVPLVEICNVLDDDCNGIIDDGVIESITITPAGPTVFCQGGSVILNATYSGTSIQWKKNGANILGATSSTYSATTTGTYSAQTSSDCDTEISNEIFIQVNKKPNAFISAGGPTTFCTGGSVTLSANTGGGLGYQWYKGALPIAGATNINYIATTTGNYKCLVTKIVSGCSKQSNAIAVAVTCKEGEELFPDNHFIIYPNPSTEKITISLSSSILTTPHSPLTITDLSGKIIAQLNISSSETEIDISNYPTGIYFINIISSDNFFTEKFIK
ncbi:MAG: T9SS type A sorting domain-containing protein [Bacteroidetes bacterium]|jgi:hypothetical protein|nr:T9SS type A sorting domain-containing protein [Bacteroidota bacterium]MBK7569129.1 T9SS type A sorting domain-containing protein [Bacteroidota bacterium]MBP8915207.1 T9SS type A sorting domain-containing protein [Chitinophagales bacterium]MBP9794497.1 T9SS type A sorting domain-containing protein [Chitinophagales bacterium]